MLCSVMQTAVTLSTGDHSEPRMEAQIWEDQVSAIREGRCSLPECLHGHLSKHANGKTR